MRNVAELDGRVGVVFPADELLSQPVPSNVPNNVYAATNAISASQRLAQPRHLTARA
jgi:hypothetical protein